MTGSGMYCWSSPNNPGFSAGNITIVAMIRSGQLDPSPYPNRDNGEGILGSPKCPYQISGEDDMLPNNWAHAQGLIRHSYMENSHGRTRQAKHSPLFWMFHVLFGMFITRTLDTPNGGSVARHDAFSVETYIKCHIRPRLKGSSIEERCDYLLEAYL
jgi:hypothetical protein